MFEEKLKKFLFGIKRQCEKHYPNCANCPFNGCEVRIFVRALDKWPKDWEDEQIERHL